MKENWERLNTALDLDHATLTDLIQPALPNRRVVAAELLTGGLANTIYKITIDGSDQPLVVRLYTRDAAACRKDIDLCDLIHGRVPIPRLIYADPAAEHYDVPYAITSFVGGALLNDLLKSVDDATSRQAGAAVGRVRAAMNAFTFDQPGFFGPRLRIAQPLAFGGEATSAFLSTCLFDRGGGQHLGEERMQRLWQIVVENATLLDQIGPEDRLVHADFNGPNIMMDQINGVWQVTAVLDWEFAFAGPPLYDLGVLLRPDPMLRSAFTAGVIEGYTDHGGMLPADWRRMIKLLDLINLCDFLAKATGQTIVRDVVDRIDHTIVHWDDLNANNR